MNFIVGCFGNENNAVNLVSKLRSEGFNARIVDKHNGLHRVSAGEGLSQESIQELRNKAQSAGYKGWVLK
jgi:cell division septation protein DedD